MCGRCAPTYTPLPCWADSSSKISGLDNLVSIVGTEYPVRDGTGEWGAFRAPTIEALSHVGKVTGEEEVKLEDGRWVPILSVPELHRAVTGEEGGAADPAAAPATPAESAASAEAAAPTAPAAPAESAESAESAEPAAPPPTPAALFFFYL